MATIERRGDGFRVRWRSIAGGARSRQCPSHKVAKALVREIEEAHARGRDWEPPDLREEPDIETIARAYLEHRALRFSADTLHSYGTRLNLFIRFLRGQQPKGPLPVSLLSRALLDEYYGWTLRAENGLHGRKRTLETARKIVEVAQLMWSWAEESERWEGIPRPRTIDLVRAPAAQVIAPSWAEMDACVGAANGWQKKLATWLRYTGLRVGESMLIEWRDVDLQRGELTIRREIDKNGVGRVIPLSPLVLDEIATWGVREGFLIPSNRRGENAREPRGRDLARAWARAGVREAVWKQRPDHAFRKGFKSGLLGLGAHPDAVDYLQGHSLGEGSRGRYIDAAHLPLQATVALVPRIGGAAGAENVVSLPKAGGR